ncbi:MAG: DNA ligase [Psychromonas sp.]|nr:DNA ligase [Psychromonas sp.]
MRFIFLFLLLCSPLLYAALPPIQLATTFRDDIIIDNYWVSEKLDGVRAYWDGKHLFSRKGNQFQAPKWFTKGFPTAPFDGELWLGRNKFELVSGIVRTKNGTKQAWKQITFMIFDLPSSPKNFTERLITMQRLIDESDSHYIKIIKQEKIATHQALQLKLNEIIKLGGEGLMLHHIDAYYQVKRSQNLMKLKRYDGAEAVVVAHIAGKGKYLGMMGSLEVKTDDNIIFKIGTGFSDKERANPPKIGDTISFQYIGKTKNGVPRFASFLRIRSDI